MAMYTYIVERTQIYLSREQARALDQEARRRGTTRSHLIREAIDRTYLSTSDRERVLAGLRASAGSWKDRTETGAEYVERIRSTGRMTRLAGHELDDRPECPMRFVCDTSVLIDFLRGDPRAITLLETHVVNGHELWGVVVTRSELLAGMRSPERAATHALLDSLQWVEIDLELADRAGEMARRHRRSHRGVELPDYLVAAGAELLGATLLTTNVRHFPMFVGLQPAYR